MRKRHRYGIVFWLVGTLALGVLGPFAPPGVAGIQTIGDAHGAPADGPTAVPAPLVAIDAGHTVAVPGAISARGQPEFEFNRALAQRVDFALRQLGVRTLLINLDGHIGSLAERPAAAAAAGADFLLSLHHDSVNESELIDWTWQGRLHTYADSWRGHSLFISRRNPDVGLSLLCGSTIGARLQRLGFTPTDKNARRRAYADAGHAVHYYDNLVVLHRATHAALLFEAGVIKHRDEELLLRDPAYQARMADGIASGIAACLQAGRGR